MLQERSSCGFPLWMKSSLGLLSTGLLLSLWHYVLPAQYAAVMASTSPYFIYLYNFVNELHWSEALALCGAIFVMSCGAWDFFAAHRSRCRLSLLPTWEQLSNLNVSRVVGDKPLAVIILALIFVFATARFAIDNPLQLQALRGFKVSLDLKLIYFSLLFLSGSAALISCSRPPQQTSEDAERLWLRTLIFSFYLLGLTYGMVALARAAYFFVGLD